MSLSPIIRRPLLVWSLVLALPAVALGEAAYNTNLVEYPISGSLPGDQVRPQAALTPVGGLLVWDDNAMDGHGQGIGALALDSNFKAAGSPFRVNQIVFKDQTRAQVALFPGGGAVFVWQGGVAGRENIYARFLSPSNTWLSGDVLLNSAKGEFHKNPAVAVQANGNAVVVWGSYNQQTSTSMQDVYAQVVSPTGQKVGSEFLVNQFTLYNQRNPSVAALGTGGFAVAWISEQESTFADNSASNYVALATGPSVDVYARIYGADGSVAGNNTNEFRVNAASNPCGTPVAAAAADGSLLVVWAEKDMITHANGWDIMARPVSSAGLLGAAQRVNTYTVGDQFAPRVAANGGIVFVAWTSMGQDGSWEGVYGQTLQFDASPVGGEVRLNSTTVGRQIHGTIAGDGSGRFLGLWASYVGGPSGVDLFAQQYASAAYVKGPTVANVFTAPPNDPFPVILDPTTVDPISLSATTTNLPPDGALVLGAPAPDLSVNTTPTLAGIVGSYNGLVWDTNQVAAISSGFITLKTASAPAAAGQLPYSGKLMLAGKTYPFSGKFLPGTGLATNYTLTGPSSFLQLRLQASLAGGDQIIGTLIDTAADGSTRTTTVSADRAVSLPVAAKSFTMVVPPVANAPVGFGYATIQIKQSGTLSWAGVLADGTKVSQSTGLSKQGLWPLFASLYGGQGVAVSWMQFTTNFDDVSGQFIWIKNAWLPQYMSLYPGGITNSVFVDGAPYTPPTAAAPVLSPANLARFLGGGLTNNPPAFTNTFALNARNQVSSPTKQFKLKLTSSSGLFSGTTPNPEQAGKKLSFQGVVYRGTNGAGLFTGTPQNGQVFITPAN